MRLRLISLFLCVTVCQGSLDRVRTQYLNRFDSVLATVTQPILVLDNVTEEWFEQPRDHFNKSDKNTFLHKFHTNVKFYRPNGPCFVYFTGEGTATANGLQTYGEKVMSNMMTNAKRVGAMVFQSEHRYFGGSIVTNNTSDPKQMRWLSSKQSMADTINWIKFIERTRFAGKKQKWIALGGSYSGGIAAWIRQAYPEIILGAVSSSGGMQPILDYMGYIGHISRDLRNIRQSCWDATKQAFDRVVNLMQTEQGRDELKSKLGLCHAILPNDPNSVGITMESLISPFEGVCQYGGDNRGPATQQSVSGLCDIMEDRVKTRRPDLLHRLRAVNAYESRDNSHWGCIDNSMIELMDGYREMNFNRGWEWLKCNELGGFQTTTQDGLPFGGNFVTIHMAMKVCRDVFNMTFEDTKLGMQATIERRGNVWDFNATNVVMLNGDQDPFMEMGMYKNEWEKPGQRVYVMKGAAHCADTYPDLPTDKPSLLEARRIIAESLDEWLSQ